MITINEDGTVDTLDGQFDLGGRQVARRRASHIVPARSTKRLVFRLLRAVCGDTGKVAAWTRSWECEWTVDLTPSSGPVVSGFYSRAAAIAYEVGWLERNGIS